MNPDPPVPPEERTTLPPRQAGDPPPSPGQPGSPDIWATLPPRRAAQSPREHQTEPWQAAPDQGPIGPLPATFGRYRLLRLLGKGGMGAVYLARDTQLDRLVALKIPSFTTADGPQIRERFLREARAAATLQHANLCPVYDVGEIDGKLYFTMAFLEGRPLADLLLLHQQLPERQVAALGRKVALALAEAHRKKIIHRDLKPANIMLNPRGEPIIMDFGLARRNDKPDAGRLDGSMRPISAGLETSANDTQLTQFGAIMGTPAYMAPEQAQGNPDDIGPGCDIYSLGVIMYELLTGKLPFKGDPMTLLSQLVFNKPTPPSVHRPNLDPRMEAICLKALAKTPEQRYRTMTELAGVLTDYLKATQQPATADRAAAEPSEAELPFAEVVSPPKKRRRPARSKPVPVWVWAVSAASVAVILLGLGLFLLLRPSQGTIPIELSDPTAQVEIRVDGTLVSFSPADPTIRLSPGRHTLDVSGPGYRPVRKELTVTRGKNPAVTIALEAATLAVKEPVYKDAATALARAREEVGKKQYLQGIAAATSAVQLDPKLAAAYLVRAEAHNGIGKRHEAIADCTQALGIDPKLSAAYALRGSTKGQIAETDAGIADLTQAIRLDAKNETAYLQRAWLYETKGDLERAIADYDLLIRLQPEQAKLYLSRGKLHARKEDTARARADFNEVIKLDPKLAAEIPATPAPALYWPDEALRKGQIVGPDLSRVKPWYIDDFKNPGSGFPADSDRGYRNGTYFVNVTGHGTKYARAPLDRATPRDPRGAFACQVEGKVDGGSARWGLAVHEDGKVQFRVMLSVPGVLFFHRAGKDGVQQLEPEPGSHPAIRKGAKGKGVVNTLRLVVQGRYLEIYVNNVAVCDPIVLNREITTPQVSLVAAGMGAKGARAQFANFVVGPADSLPPLEKRGAMPKKK